MAVDAREVAAVFAGGALGTLARAGLEELAAVDPGHWPWPTFTANVVGAFLLGLVLASRLRNLRYGRPLLSTGFCGGLTTFSTMQVETLTMIEHGDHALATGYTTVSVVAGLAAVWAATRLVPREVAPG